MSSLEDTCVLARRHICLRLAVNWLRLIALRKQLSGRSGKNMVSAVNWFAVIELKQCTLQTTFVSEVSCTEMILGFAINSRYACLGNLDKWAASRLQVACK